MVKKFTPETGGEEYTIYEAEELTERGLNVYPLNDSLTLIAQVYKGPAVLQQWREAEAELGLLLDTTEVETPVDTVIDIANMSSWGSEPTIIGTNLGKSNTFKHPRTFGGMAVVVGTHLVIEGAWNIITSFIPANNGVKMPVLRAKSMEEAIALIVKIRGIKGADAILTRDDIVELKKKGKI
jgi:hypothetical protein